MSDHPYQPKHIESAVQQLWRDQDLFKACVDPTKEKFFCLSMFPYPSGSLHMGHVRNYTLGDVISRFHRMRGKNVLQPIGWDAFGLPAENAAVANQTAPASWTYGNIQQMREQLEALGFGYDWSREVTTCKPDYYRWEQWFFTELMNKGLVYRKNATVNWDPVDQTVLANEQVVDGRGWRSGALVEQKEIPQWFIKITDYAQQLLDDLDTLDDWPSQVKTAQRNWIGRSTGAMVHFQLDHSRLAATADIGSLEVFTTRPDTLFGVSYLAIAAQHPLAQLVARTDQQIARFCEQCKQHKMAEAELAVLDKLGVDTGLTAIHPLTKQSVPIWVANFVLMDYGTGAVMAVPAHDQRDWEFAKTYQLPITPVIVPDKHSSSSGEDFTSDHDFDDCAYTDGGTLVASGQFSGLANDDAKQAIVQKLVELEAGTKTVNYRLRDWGVSRQRYWGAPIPVAYDADGNGIPIPEHLLPVVLPEDVVMDGVRSPIKSDPQWAELSLNGKTYQRETDTFDTFMESSWYYARMASAPSDNMLEPAEADYWLPVDQYVGGIEHAILHLLYARFFHKLMRDHGLVSSDEPFKRLLCQGMVLADSFYREDGNGKRVWYPPTQVEWRIENDQSVPVLKLDGRPVIHAGMTKMSKSKNNGINPREVMEQYGADTVRLFTMFAAPPEQTLEWNSAAVDGAYRFLKRIYKLVQEHINKNHSLLDSLEYDTRQAELRFELHACIQKVTEDYEQRQTFNTAIAKIMELSNALQKFEVKSDEDYTVVREVISNLLKLLNPITPHLCQHLWSELGYKGLIETSEWPQHDPTALVKATQLIVVQVNGKVRAKIDVATDADQDSIQDVALAQENVQQFIKEKSIRKVIYVPGKLLNIVVG